MFALIVIAVMPVFPQPSDPAVPSRGEAPE
jgi:hypothetical protein